MQAAWDIIHGRPIEEAPLPISIKPVATAHVAGRLEHGSIISRNGPQENVTYVVYDDAFGDGVDLIYYLDWGRAPRFEELIRFRKEPATHDYAFIWNYGDTVEITGRSGGAQMKWNGKGAREVARGEEMIVRHTGNDMRGSGFKSFLIWDSNVNYRNPKGN